MNKFIAEKLKWLKLIHIDNQLNDKLQFGSWLVKFISFVCFYLQALQLILKN